jgi:hypothetical protein
MYLLIILYFYINSVSCYTEFFDDYHTFPKDDSLGSYGYDISRVCNIRQIDDIYYAGLTDTYTIFKAAYTKLFNFDTESQVQNCFNYKSFSYIITRKNNRTSIMRGRLTKSFKFQNYDKLIFDHLASKLYAQQEYNIFEIDMAMLENFWIIDNYPQRLVQERKNISLDSLFKFRNLLFGKIEDLMIFNNTLYFIRPEPRGRAIYKTKVGEIQEEYVSEYEKPYFDFIPFIQISKYYETNSKIKLNLGSLSPTIVISLPSSSIKSKEELPMPLIIALYFLDAIFVIITIWGMKYIFKLSKDKYKKLKAKDEAIEQADINNDTYLASLPYRDIVISNK